MSPRRTTILMDAGGVFIDESELETFIAGLVTRLLVAEGIAYSEDVYWEDTREAVLRFCPSTPKAVLWKRCGGDVPRYERLLDAYVSTLRADRPPLRLYAEMPQELPVLAERFPIILAGQYGPEVYDLLEGHGLGDVLANRLSQRDFPITKPDPRYVALIAERSGVAPASCIMVGDRIDKDIIPAKQNGMGTVFVRTGIYRTQQPRTLEEVPDITLPGLSGLAEAIIRRWG